MPQSISQPLFPGDLPDDLDEPVKRRLFWHVWRVLRRRFAPILLFVFLLLPPLWLYLLGQPYLYRAVAVMLIEDKEPRIGFIEGVLGLDPQLGENLSTQLHLLQGTVLIARVVEREHLLDSGLIAEIAPAPEKNGWLPPFLELLGIPVPPAPPPPSIHSRDAALTALVKHIRSQVRIRPIANSQMVEISFVSRDPQLSARVVNAIARNHIEWQMETRTAMFKRVSQLLVQRLDALTDNLEQAESALEAFRQRTGMITSEEKASIEWQQLQAVNDEYSMTIAKSMALQSRIQKMEDWIAARNNRKSSPPGSDPELEFSSLLKELVLESSQKEGRIATLSGQLVENHPSLSRMRKDLAKTNASISTEANRLLAVDLHDLESVQGRLVKIEKRLAQEQKKFKEYQNKAVELRKLEREMEANRELHNSFLKRFKDTNILGDLNIPVIQLVDPAEPPNRIHSPKFMEMTLLTLILGVLGGSLAAVFLELLDPTLKTPYETERAIDLPLLGWVPLISARHPETRQERMRSCAPGSPYGEALQGIRTSLMMIHLHEQLKTVMIVSCGPGEGRSELVRGLANVCALDGERVLILDADFRGDKAPGGTAHRDESPEKQADRGISGIIRMCDTLVGEIDSGWNTEETRSRIRAIIMDRLEKSADGIDFLHPGWADANPTKILSSPHWPVVMQILREEFDRVFIDTAPVLRTTDAQLLGVHVEAAILLIRSAHTHKEHLLTARKRMIRSRMPLVGVILTRLDMKKHRAELREYGHG
ncbi:MAG: polysaccharide biosynthesis tyrosine autokinase [Magnetococcales bacterium]|nr:polysaccharide biosynthesis tyrosine autokinase [Magnetococcales bacterium]